MLLYTYFLFLVLCPHLFPFFNKMHPVGFEPTHLSIAELKSAPLDHSGTNAFYYITFFLVPLHFLFLYMFSFLLVYVYIISF